MNMLPKCSFGAKSHITFCADKLSGTLVLSQVCGHRALNVLLAPGAQVLRLAPPLTCQFVLFEFVWTQENPLAGEITIEDLGFDEMHRAEVALQGGLSHHFEALLTLNLIKISAADRLRNKWLRRNYAKVLGFKWWNAFQRKTNQVTHLHCSFSPFLHTCSSRSCLTTPVGRCCRILADRWKQAGFGASEELDLVRRLWW